MYRPVKYRSRAEANAKRGKSWQERVTDIYEKNFLFFEVILAFVTMYLSTLSLLLPWYKYTNDVVVNNNGTSCTIWEDTYVHLYGKLCGLDIGKLHSNDSDDWEQLRIVVLINFVFTFLMFVYVMWRGGTNLTTRTPLFESNVGFAVQTARLVLLLFLAILTWSSFILYGQNEHDHDDTDTSYGHSIMIFLSIVSSISFTFTLITYGRKHGIWDKLSEMFCSSSNTAVAPSPAPAAARPAPPPPPPRP